ncbi:MAG: hypothetical protein KDB24_10025 [Microthrixaceae bacterium]|nr:hypothetical protein [Microthrixaceae bacterium]
MSNGDPAPDETSVYGALPVDDHASRPTSAYGAASPPPWSAPGDAGPSRPTAQAAPVPPVAASGYAPAAPAPYAPLGATRWNLWAGIAAATSLAAIGGVWRLGKAVTNLPDFQWREQLAFAMESGHLVLGLLTLAALASKRRTPTAAVTLLLGASLLVTVTYNWYLQMDRIYGGFDSELFFEQLAPSSIGTVLLAAATMAAAFLLRADRTVQR